MGRGYPQVATDKPYRVMPPISSGNAPKGRRLQAAGTVINAPFRAIGLLVLTFVMCLSGSLLAQTGRTTISGRVVDPTGAVLAGAKVVVTNVETNFSVSLDTNEKGYYEASQLLPGQYKLEAEAPGFGKLVRQGITLVAGSPISIELKLAVGKNQETMIVTADAPLINTEAATGGQVLSNETIVNTPVSGANASLLLKLSANIQSDRATNFYMAGNLNALGASSGIGTAGQSGRNEFYLDGAPNQSGNHNMAYAPSTDEVSEMKTETSGFDASLGKTLGVSVVTTSKGGTNDYHGMVREMYYDGKWQAMSHFGATTYQLQTAKACGNPASAACAKAKAQYGQPGVIEHNSGLNVGGPVILPKVFNGKDKLFFFLNISRDQYTGAGNKTYTVPTALQRTGDFSDLPGCAAGNCGAYTIYNPLSVQADPTKSGRYVRTAVPGNNLNNVLALKSLMANNPILGFINKYYPLPNTADSSGNYAASFNYALMTRDPQLFKANLLRMDYTPSQKDRFFVRLSRTNYEQRQQGFLLEDLDRRLMIQQGKIITGGWTHMFSNAAILDTAVGYTQYSDVRTYPNLMKYKPSDMGLPGYMDSMSQLGGYPQIPQVNYSSVYSAFGVNPSPMSLQRILSLRSGLSYIKGNHTYTLGGEVRQQMMSAVNSGNTSGLLTFNNDYTRQYSDTTGNPQTLGLAYAALMLGIPSSTTFDVPAAYKAHNPYFSWYVQDSWRATPKLTVSLGLRYEFEYGPVDAGNREVTYWDPTATLPTAFSSTAQTQYATLFNSEYKKKFTDAGLTAPANSIQVMGGNTYAGVNGASTRRYDNNWRLMPKLGIAYQLTPTTVIRGGYGMFYDTTNVLNQSINQNGYSQSTVNNVSNDYGQTWSMGNPAAGVSSLTNPFPVLTTGARYLQPIGNSLGSAMYLGNSYTFYPQDYKPARQHRWQAEFQKQLGTRDALVIGYTGSWTDRLEVRQDLNSVPYNYFTGGNVNNPNFSTLDSKVTNPFYFGGGAFDSLKASNPALYNQLANVGTFKSPTITLSALTKPYPWMGNIYKYTNNGASKFHSLNVQFNHRLSKGFQATVNYQRTFQYDRDWMANSYDLMPTWELSNNSRPSRLTGSGRLELPFGRGQRWLQNGILSKIFGGQTLDFSWELQQGQLINLGNLIYTGDPTRIGSSLMLSKPVYVLDPAKSTNYVQWLNPAVIDRTNQLQSYNIRVLPQRIDGVRQMGINNFNINYQRSISLSERFKFIGRFECIDVFNHRVIGTPNTTSNSTQFGQVTGDNGTYGRWIQIQGKITF